MQNLHKVCRIGHTGRFSMINQLLLWWCNCNLKTIECSYLKVVVLCGGYPNGYPPVLLGNMEKSGYEAGQYPDMHAVISKIWFFKKIHPYTYLVKCMHIVTSVHAYPGMMCDYQYAHSGVHVWICPNMHNIDRRIHIQWISRTFQGVTGAFQHITN